MAKPSTSNYHLDEEETRGRPGYYDFHAPPPLAHDKRTLSYPSTIASSTTTASSTSSTTKRVTSWLKPSVKPSPKVNVHTTCGRHTDQLLFGGPSLTEMARSVFKKKN
ncbi:hypothetical protein LEL_05117 [Akanthomyces lecanii RCEF 1005]|uniref:Uncharacterized protein n=1 Tax=Akanthomyces lecanii RCEF 1005 TaxID=1081108 RepID=A0A168HUQ8_CORDF|nr:hypothetical protein LEL_05117 [Akanthomyces lecanii RCEF 1005]